jgi:hypothetical protein
LRSECAWTPLMIEAEPAGESTNLEASDPDHYFSANEEYPDKIFRKYATAIDSYQDEAFDLVLVDGRVRPSCIKHGASKVKIGGLLILDNAERDYYLEKMGDALNGFRLVLDDFGPSPYSNIFTQTKIWRRIN